MHEQLIIGFIGGGNMARAIVAGLLRSGHPAEGLKIADPSQPQRTLLANLSPQIEVSADNDRVAAQSDVLMLAVKPQLMETVIAQLGPRQPAQLVVSVAAGLTLKRLGAWLGQATALVRVMPNQPALVGAGMAVLVASENVSAAQRSQADYIMRATGEAGWVDDELLIDAVTAVSGSGPAYFYLLMEVLEEWAAEQGIPAELARQLAINTARGAGMAARETGIAPAELRASVTSPGGTTAAAISALEQAGLRAIFRDALNAARERSLELGRPTD